MPRGAKDKYTDKQKRKAAHIEEGYEERGVDRDEAERRAWATVNKLDGGGRAGGRATKSRTAHPTRRKRAPSKSAASRTRGSRRKSASRR
jgi:hypothetical protein